MSDESIFKPFAEEKVKHAIAENQLILNQYFNICLAINQLADDKKMTARAWKRVEKAVNGSLAGEKMHLESDIEKQMVALKLKRDGIKVHLIVNDERLLEATKRELANMRKIAEDNRKAMETAQMSVESAVLPDEGENNV